MKKQAGFTLIELIVVIVILGILAATALPRFVDLGGQASTAAAEGVAGAMASASSINVGQFRATNGAQGQAVNDTAANLCVETHALWATNGANSLLQGGLPAGYTLDPVTAGAPPTCAANRVVQCTVNEPDRGGTAIATIACTN